MPQIVSRLAAVLQVSVVHRLRNRLVVHRLLRRDRGVTDREIRGHRTMMIRGLNDTVIDQQLRFPDDVNEVGQLGFPDTVAVLKLVPKGTLRRVGQDHQREHLRRLGPGASYEGIDGSRLVHHTRASEILDAAIRLLGRGALT